MHRFLHHRRDPASKGLLFGSGIKMEPSQGKRSRAGMGLTSVIRPDFSRLHSGRSPEDGVTFWMPWAFFFWANKAIGVTLLIREKGATHE